MRQRGRRSADNLASINGQPIRLTAPKNLRVEERALFTDLVNACHPSHFVESDKPLLISYVQASLMSRSMAHDPQLVAVWATATRTQAILASKLRLAPSSRDDRKTVGSRQVPPLHPPWER